MGKGLFAGRDFTAAERILCVYYGKKITASRAHSAGYKPDYIAEVRTHTGRPLCIDAWDATNACCYNPGGYANDAINWAGQGGRWNAEFTVDDYDPTKIILRPTRNIAKGEQIMV